VVERLGGKVISLLGWNRRTHILRIRCLHRSVLLRRLCGTRHGSA
jgi:hypothetical protein